LSRKNSDKQLGSGEVSPGA